MEAGEYNEFFKATFREFVDPLATAHFTVEGTIEFSAILFVPGMAPFEQQARARPARRPLSSGRTPGRRVAAALQPVRGRCGAALGASPHGRGRAPGSGARRRARRTG